MKGINMLYIVGLGPGDSSYLTERAKRNIECADIVIGGRRNIEALGKINQEIFYIGANLDEMKEYIHQNKEREIVVLASGDPLIYGIASYIIRELDLAVEIVPGISAIQYALSRFKVDANDIYISSSHGRCPDYDFIFMHKKIAMLTDKIIGPREIAMEVKKRGLDYKIMVGENLSYPNERLIEGGYQEILKLEKYSMSVVILEAR